jgi:hypothetical protein
MFHDATSFNQPLHWWNVSGVIDMEKMFFGASSFNQNICQWYKSLQQEVVVLNMFLNSNCTDKSDPNFVNKSTFCNVCDTTKDFNETVSYSIFFYLKYSLHILQELVRNLCVLHILLTVVPAI